MIRIEKTKKRVFTRRGVVWLGQTCNQRCYFCYFISRIEDHSHPLHAFMSLDKAKEIMNRLRYFYGNRSVDIQGGEPTIFKEILPLVSHCREIGLSPTLITNGLVLARPGVAQEYHDAGIRDFLVSLHGYGEVHDEVVGVPGAFEKISKALENIREAEIPIRINSTMSKPVIPVLTKVAEKAIEVGALAVNYIAFNPFVDQHTGRRRNDTVARYSEIVPQLTESIDMLEEAGVEVNVRYLPLCLAEERHRKNFYNYQQLPFDLHEWDYQSWMWSMMTPQMMKEGGLNPLFRLGTGARTLYRADHLYLRDNAEAHPFKTGIKYAAQRTVARIQQAVNKEKVYREEAKDRAVIDCNYTRGPACAACHLRYICDGFHGDYAEFFGMDEARPVTDVPVTEDPRVFIREQEKHVLAEDCDWAL
ncbi:MAG: radical SAM protein [Candidatus Hydrogenedens sp.]|nr:radical SAM protein [Candidatus Hydrogenedens sp.]